MDIVPVHYLKQYAYCPRKLISEKLRPAKERQVMQNARHARREIARMLERTEIEIVSSTESVMPLPELIERYKKKYGEMTRKIITEHKDAMKLEGQNVPQFIKQIWPRIMRESEQRATNLHKIMERTGLYGSKLWNALSPKLRTDVMIEGIGMRGRIDLIKDYPAESIPYIFTARKPPKYGVWDSDKLAAGAYIMMIQASSIPCTEARVVYLGEKEDAEREVPMNGFLQKRVLATRDAVVKLFNAGIIPPKCARCTQEKACYDTKVRTGA